MLLDIFHMRKLKDTKMINNRIKYKFKTCFYQVYMKSSLHFAHTQALYYTVIFPPGSRQYHS